MRRTILALALLLGMLGFAGTPIPARAADVRYLRFADALATDDVNHLLIYQYINKILAQKTNGALQIRIYPNSSLGSVDSLVQGVQTGTVDIVFSGTSYLSGLIPEIQALELPFLFASPKDAESILEGTVGQGLNKQIASKGTMENLGFWEVGARNVTNNKRAVHTPADLKGLKLRTLPSPIQVEAWKLLGAEPTPMPFSEVFSALSQGTIDGQENPVQTIYDSHLYEVQKYLSLTGHVFTTTPILVSEKTMQSLSPGDRQALKDAFAQGTPEQWRRMNKANVDDLTLLKGKGMVIDEHPDIPAFKALVQPVYQDFRKKFGSTLLDAIMAHK